MNVKSLLLAAVVATFAGGAFANNFDNGEVQVAQMTSTTKRVVTDAGYASRIDLPATAAPNTTEARTRAEVRAETLKYLHSGDARSTRSLYMGGAQ